MLRASLMCVFGRAYGLPYKMATFEQRRSGYSGDTVYARAHIITCVLCVLCHKPSVLEDKCVITHALSWKYEQNLARLRPISNDAKGRVRYGTQLRYIFSYFRERACDNI